MARMVYCVKLGRELPGLERPPFPGELGQRIYEHISKQAYDMWQAESTNVINERGLSMGDPEARKVLRQEMEKFFFDNPKQPVGTSSARVVGAANGPRLVYEQISQQAYDMWEAQRTLIINHYGLNLADPESRKILREQMEEFFFGSDAQMPEGWVPEAAGAGASSKDGGGAASSKGGGGGAPASKGGGGGAAQRK